MTETTNTGLLSVSNKNQDNFFLPFLVCPAGYTKCDTIDRCYPGRSRCDRHVDCQDESDETSCGMYYSSVNNSVYVILQYL